MSKLKYFDGTTWKVVNGEVTGDTLPIGAEVDFDGETVPVGWEEINDPSEYSTTEQVIGKWIDGKPLYRKVVTGTFTSSSSRTVVDAVPGIDRIINCYGTYSNQSSSNPDQLFGTPQIGVTGQIDSQSQARKSSGNVLQFVFTTGSYAGNTGSYSVVCEYTKAS